MTRFRSLDRPAYAVAATALSAIVFAGPAGAAASDVAQGYGKGTAALGMLLAQADAMQAAPAQERPNPQARPEQAPAKRPNTRRNYGNYGDSAYISRRGLAMAGGELPVVELNVLSP